MNLYIQENENFDRNNPNYQDENLFLAVPWDEFWRIGRLDTHYFRLPKQACKELIIKDGNFTIKDIQESKY